MSDLHTYIKNKIDNNKLPLSFDNTIKMVNELKKVNTKNYTDKQLFYQYILNIAGKIIANVDIEVAECFGYLEPKLSFNADIIYYEFFTEEDYYDWLSSRKEIYAKIDNIEDIRILNYVELCTMDYIKDISTICDYEIIHNDKVIKKFCKTEFGVNVDTPLSFIKFVSSFFRKNMVYKPV